MPGVPANSPNLTIPRFDNGDEANFALQVNSVVDAIDANVPDAIDDAITAATVPEALRVVGAVGQPAYGIHSIEGDSYFGTAAFYKKGERVYLKGRVEYANSSASAPHPYAFILPAGYRPSSTERFLCVSDFVSTGWRVTITTDGGVSVAGVGFPPWGAYLDGVDFRVA